MLHYGRSRTSNNSDFRMKLNTKFFQYRGLNLFRQRNQFSSSCRPAVYQYQCMVLMYAYITFSVTLPTCLLYQPGSSNFHLVNFGICSNRRILLLQLGKMLNADTRVPEKRTCVTKY